MAGGLTKEVAEREAIASFKAVFEYGPKIELDHQLVYHARTYLSIDYLGAARWNIDTHLIDSHRLRARQAIRMSI